MKRNRTLQELFSFPGFRAMKGLEGKFGDPKARIIKLKREKKRRAVQVADRDIERITIARRAKHGMWMQRDIACMYVLKGVELIARGAVCE
jgi:hypothetical protein